VRMEVKELSGLNSRGRGEWETYLIVLHDVLPVIEESKEVSLRCFKIGEFRGAKGAQILQHFLLSPSLYNSSTKFLVPLYIPTTFLLSSSWCCRALICDL